MLYIYYNTQESKYYDIIYLKFLMTNFSLVNTSSFPCSLQIFSHD